MKAKAIGDLRIGDKSPQRSENRVIYGRKLDTIHKSQQCIGHIICFTSLFFVTA